MQKIRVVLFTDSDVFAGTERHMLDLGLALREEGVAVFFACPSASSLADRGRAEGIPLIFVEKGRGIDIAAICKVAKLIARQEVDLLHAHNGRTALISVLGSQLARRGKVVATQHFISPARDHRKGLTGGLSRGVHRWTGKRIAHFITVSQAARTAMIERGESGEKIAVIANGIAKPDLARLEAPESVRKRYGVSSYAPLIACVARLEPEKDIANLVRAMAKVQESHQDVVCVIAGEGSLRESLILQIKQAGLENTVQLAGFLPDTLSLMNAANVFVLPSIAEPFGLVLLEAMALGKAVIATRAGGPVEIVQQGQTGLLVQPGNHTELASSLIELLNNPSRLAEFGTLGRDRFLDQFTAKRMAVATYQIYKKVLNGRTGT